MLSHYNKYYTRLQVLYYATLGYIPFKGICKGGGGRFHGVQTAPPPHIENFQILFLKVKEKEKGMQERGYLLTYFKGLRFVSGGAEINIGGGEGELKNFRGGLRNF